MSQRVVVTQANGSALWYVRGTDPSLAGIATLVSGGFVLRVDAADPTTLVELSADPATDEGRAVLDAWLGRAPVDQLSDTGHAIEVIVPETGAKVLRLGEIALMSLLRVVDAGPRDALWAAEIVGAWCDLADLDHRFRIEVDDDEVAAGLAALADTAVRINRPDWTAPESLRKALVDLAARLVNARQRPDYDADALFAELQKVTEALTLGDPAKRRHEPAKADRARDEPAAIEFDVYRVSINRARLPRGLLLALDAGLSVVRDGNRGTARLDGITAWAEDMQLFLVGRTPVSGSLRTLDEFTKVGSSSATATMDFHESDFVEGDALVYSIVDRAGAVGPQPPPEEAAFELAQSELARLSLISAEVVAEFAGPRAERLKRAGQLLRSDLRASLTALVDAHEVDAAMNMADEAGSAADFATLQLPRSLFGEP